MAFRFDLASLPPPPPPRSSLFPREDDEGINVSSSFIIFERYRYRSISIAFLLLSLLACVKFDDEVPPHKREKKTRKRLKRETPPRADATDDDIHNILQPIIFKITLFSFSSAQAHACACYIYICVCECMYKALTHGKS